MLLSWTQYRKRDWVVAISHILVISILVQACNKHFPITTVLIFLNCAPLITEVLKGLVGGAPVAGCETSGKLSLVLIGVLFITLGAPEDGSGGDHNLPIHWAYYLLLSLMPVTLAFGNIAMVKLQTLDYTLIPFYSNLSVFLLSLLVCLIHKHGFLPK